MRTSFGLWDTIFGKKLTVEIPMPDGRTKRVSVTERWVAEMQQGGLVKPVGGQKVKVHVLDPANGLLADLYGLSPGEASELGLPQGDGPYRVEHWVIGKEISAEQYDHLRDPTNGELYALMAMNDGKRRPYCLARERWLEAKRAIEPV